VPETLNVKNTILIVDQEKVLGDLLVDIFPAESFEIFKAVSADEGRQLADLHVPNLAIVDPLIPSGFQLMDYLCSNGTSKVLALSSNCEVLEQARERGFDLVIAKNDGLLRLVVAIQSAGFNVVVPGTGQARILIVDDAADTRVMVSKFLAQRGYSTVLAASGQEALEALERDPSIALVLLDIIMPDIGGVEVLRGITKGQHKPVVVMVSAIHDQEIAHRTLELGAFDYILKPIDLDALESTIVAGLTHADYSRKSWWKRLSA
jgi:DNA-binding response OmpR family regulator